MTAITFDFIAPNMFGSDNEFDSEMQEFRDNEKAAKVKIAVQNDDGIEPNTDRVKRAVKYASRGGGNIKARAKGNKTYNSDDEVKRTYVDDIKEKGADLVKIAKDIADRIFGRE